MGRLNVVPDTIALTGVPGPLGPEIEVEDLFPHRDQEADVPLLSGIFLRHLQLDRLVGCTKRTEERRHGFARLEVDGTVLDLENDIASNRAVEIVEVVPRRASTIVLQVAPVHMVVVDEPAIEDDAAVRRQRTRDHVGGVSMRAPVRRWSEASFGIGLDTTPAKSGTAR